MYDFGPLFCVRLAGVPFEVLDDLATPGIAALARDALALETEIAAAIAAVRADPGMRDLARSVRARVKKAIGKRGALPIDIDGSLPAFARYAALIDKHTRVRAVLEDRLGADGATARARLWTHAQAQLPDFLAIQSESAYRELVRSLGSAGERSNDVRYTERVLARYLQRVVAKNDTISRFGPTVWGHIDPAGTGFDVQLEPGITERAVAIERWVVRAVVAAMNRDPLVRPELCPRRHPNGRLEGTMFVRHDAGAQALDAADLEELQRCDGTTRAHQLDAARLEKLAAAGSVIWAVELVAFDHDPLATLIDDVRAWRDGDPKRTWLAHLDALADTAQRFARVHDAPARGALMEEVRTRVASLGGVPPGGKILYQATNPIIEECARTGHVTLGGASLAPVLDDMAPWLDLFSDAYALAASRCYQRLAALLETAPRRGDGTSLASFITHCDAHGFSLREGGVGKVAREVFGEIKREVSALVATRADAAECELTREDCHVLRRNHALPPPGDHGWACPDMQIAAPSLDDVAAGTATWIVAELHGIVAPLQRAVSWSCRDVDAMRDIYRGDEPWMVTSRVAATTASVHVSTESMLTTVPNAVFCAPERARPHWRFVAPSETEVVVLHDVHDVRVRARATGADLGSLVRAPWMVIGGLHPFFPVELVPHTPRLRIGKVIVQRRSWRVSRTELEASIDRDVTPELVVAVERLRAARDLPRWVYVRPAVADHTSVLSRDRDVKPMYVDLESTIFLEIFCRYLEKFGALDVVEMLPRPDQLCWREDGGRYSFELRMMTPPRRA